MNMMADMEADLYRRGVRFVHFTKNSRAAAIAEAEFWIATGSTVDHPDDPRAKFVPCMLNGYSTEHYPVVVFQDFDELDALARKEALAVPAPERDNRQVMIIKFRSFE